MKLKPKDPVTAVQAGKVVHLFVYDVIDDVVLEGAYVGLSFRTQPRHRGGPLSLYVCKDEGVVWIRGHHAPDSRQALALLAALALRT